MSKLKSGARKRYFTHGPIVGRVSCREPNLKPLSGPAEPIEDISGAWVALRTLVTPHTWTEDTREVARILHGGRREMGTVTRDNPLRVTTYSEEEIEYSTPREMLEDGWRLVGWTA